MQGGNTGVAFETNIQKLFLCLTEPIPASSSTDPPLAKAGPSSSSGSTSGVKYLKTGEKPCRTEVGR